MDKYGIPAAEDPARITRTLRMMLLRLMPFTDDLEKMREDGWSNQGKGGNQDEEGNITDLDTEIMPIAQVKVDLLKYFEEELDELFEIYEGFE